MKFGVPARLCAVGVAVAAACAVPGSATAGAPESVQRAAAPADAVDPLPQFTGLVGSCQSKIATVDGRCVGPTVTVLHENTVNCPGSAQFFTATDANGVAIDWTFSNGTNSCVSVSYSLDPPSSFGLCEYWFYVPAGDATGRIIFGYWVGGVKHFFGLDENPVAGWQKLFTDAPQSVTNSGIPGGFLDAGPSLVQWSDNNNQTAGAFRLGWGSGDDHAIMEVCGGRG